MHSAREDLLKRYAACEVTWRELQERGFRDYVEVLAGLGDLGLRPPFAPTEGPSQGSRERGRRLIRDALRARL